MNFKSENKPEIQYLGTGENVPHEKENNLHLYYCICIILQRKVS